ncbi:MAG: hypothetical protein ACI37Z_08210 [Candidatus Gastranaerophilaceae bacterium]
MNSLGFNPSSHILFGIRKKQFANANFAVGIHSKDKKRKPCTVTEFSRTVRPASKSDLK